MIKKTVNATMAGMYIGLGATAYLVSDNKFYGSFFFCVGIFLVTHYYNMLFTKVVPMSVFKDFSISDIFITFIGNLLGGTIYAFLISQTRLATKISPKITELIDTKTGDSYISLFIMAFFCAVLVAYSSLTSKVLKDNKGIATIMIFLFIMAFVIIGFDHVVANVFYYSFYIFTNGTASNMAQSFIIVLLGNVAGGLATGYLELYRTKSAKA